MMPSRGVQLSARVARASHYHARFSARAFSSRLSPPIVRSTGRPGSRVGQIYQQRRHLSWNPATWWPSATSNTTQEFEAAHIGSKGLQSTATESTSPTAPSIQPSAVDVSAASPQAQATVTTPIDVNPDTFSELDIPAAESIGYLKSLGLDYGWGPTSMIEWLLEHIHVYTGLPWWSSIALTAVVLRTAMFPLTIKMSDTQARLTMIKPHLEILRAKMTTAAAAGDLAMQQGASKEMNELRLRSGASVKWMTFNLGANIVFAWCGLKLMRHMADMPVPGFLEGGTAWFTNLAAADPYYALPVIMGAALHLNFRLNANDPSMGMNTTNAAVKPLMLYILPAVTVLGTAWLSTAAVVWLAASGFITLTTARLVLNPGFRERVGIMPMPAKDDKPTTASQGSSPGPRGGPGGAGRTITINASSKATSPLPPPRAGSGLRYEAPKSRQTPRSAPGPAAGLRNKSATPTISEDEKKARDILAELSSRAQAASSAGGKGLLARYTSWGASKINDMGSGYEAVMQGGREMMDKARKSTNQYADSSGGSEESRTRSKEYMRRANEYERMVQRNKEREGRRAAERRERHVR